MKRLQERIWISDVEFSIKWTEKDDLRLKSSRIK